MSQPAAITEPMVRRILITNDDGINAPVMSALGGLNAICLGVERALDRDISRRSPSSNRACA